MFEKYDDFAKEMSDKTGEIYPTTKLYRLFNNLKAALSMGLSLPDWCSKEDYEKLEDLAHLSFLIRTHTPQMTRIVAGPIVQKFLENIEKSGKGLDGKEIYLYSGHDINIAQFCNAHNFTEVPKIPDYGTALIIEKLRGLDSQVYVRFLMWTGAGGEKLIPITVKGCGYECPVSQYKSLVASILPDEESRSFSLCFVLLLGCESVNFTSPSYFKLELLQVLFRHGDRTATKTEVYKNDPYIQHYEDLGYGVLTKVGMERMYKIGQMLRQRYDNFLGDYKDGHVYAYSSDTGRTKQSLQLVLAGLYPPSNETAWRSEIKWTPIPTNYDKEEFNFLSSIDSCTTYREMQGQVEEWPEVKKMFEKHSDFVKEIRNKTGEVYSPTSRLYRLYNNLRAALSMGLSLPDWCSKEDYEKLEEIAHLSYLILTHTPLMTRIATGPTVEKFLENIEESGKGLDGKTVYLYSGHDINIAQFCNAHNFTNVPKIPDYGSALIVEKLRGPDSRVYVRFIMWTGAGGELLVPINVKGCGHECPVSRYKSLVASILPDEESRSCFPTCET
ncbi:hypothetical protein TSAR_013713 [Trichomalopsis sarcophagae]|uniref:acid phosphatase n=1 Tax=Trichomalopsis sarcophagae TaxID=543379 RepID=A0A232FLU9_9HYME|nr:hypothetical protein TSAR_013713 [Trichomalopsis sarcophagae]